MLYASFCTADGIYSGAFNRLAACVTGGNFCHCQFIFEWNDVQLSKILSHKGFHKLRRAAGCAAGEKVYVCVDVAWGGLVDFRLLYPDALEPYYCVPEKNKVPVLCSFEEEVQLALWLQLQQGKSYDRLGALMCWLPWRPKRLEYECYFCSQLMACGLEQVGLFRFRNIPTPNRLFEVLSAVAVAVPSRVPSRVPV